MRRPLDRLAMVLAPTSCILGLLLVVGWVPQPDAPAPALLELRATVDTTVTFTADILPIFESRCVECHGGTDENGQVVTEAYLNLLTYEGVMAGSEFGLVIEPGDPDASTLVEMIEVGDMPEEGDPVPPEEIELIRAWIAAGAPQG